MKRGQIIGFFRRHENRIYLAILVAAAYVSHRAWFDPSAILTYSDWSYIPLLPAKEIFISLGAWASSADLGGPNIMLPFAPLFLIWSLIANLGGSANLAIQLTVLIPTAILGFISPYFLFNKLLKERFIAFVIALFYGTVTYFLSRQGAHALIALVYALSPLVFFFFLRALERNKLRSWAVFALLFSLAIICEIRISLILFGIIILYFALFHLREIKKYLPNLAGCALIGLGINAFWLAPLVFGGLSEPVMAVANRGLFGDFLFDLPHALSLTEWGWTGGRTGIPFVVQAVPWYAWLAPAIAFSALLFTDSESRPKALFFGALALAGIFLTKQSAAPLPGAYLWLYEHVPGFNLYREASKFYLLTSIGYAGLIGYGLQSLKRMSKPKSARIVFAITCAILIAVSLWNLKPMVTTEYGGIFVPREMPADYEVLAKYLDVQEGFFRTLWVPSASRWGAYSLDHPKASAVTMNQTAWKSAIGFRDGPVTKQENVAAGINLPSVNKLLDEAAVKYVIVPIRNEGRDMDLIKDYGGNRRYYLKQVNAIKRLELIQGGWDGLAVYLNPDYEPHISTAGASFYPVNPSKYRIRIKGLKDKQALRFLEAYNPGWELYIEPAKSDQAAGAKVVKRFPRQKVVELQGHYRVFEGEELGYLAGREPVFKASHRATKLGANQWTLDAGSIKKNYSKTLYRTNKDGSIDVNLVLYFRPQSFYYLGEIISIFGLIACLIFICSSLYRERRRSVGHKASVS